MASPALHPNRPAHWVDPRHPAEYPILLGDSLKGSGNHRSIGSLLNVRYNWQPKSGFGSRQSKLTRTGDEYQLSIGGGDSGEEELQYTGAVELSKTGKSDDQPGSLALVFDRSKSCFVLEAISASLDLNLQHGGGHSSKDARNLPRLPVRRAQNPESTRKTEDGSKSPAAEDETPDPSNPYDYRHFLAEARQNIEKSAQQPGNRTPLSGVSTPMSVGSSFLATTPQFKPAPGTSKPTVQREKKTENLTRGLSRTSTPLMAPKATAKREAARSAEQTLSKARITDSDEEEDEAAGLLQASAKPLAGTKNQEYNHQRPSRPSGKGHTRHISANIGSSPHIIINDDDGGLEIDMGSPPPEDRPTRRGRVDPEMFRSHTGTPIGGMTSNAQSRQLSHSRPPVVQEQGYHHKDRDVMMKDIEGDSTVPSDEDGDVEEFELGSPRDKRLSVPNSGSLSRIEDNDGAERDRNRQHHQEAPTPPVPNKAHYDDDDDDEDLLAAALEAALEEEEEEAGPAVASTSGVGLGIGMSMAAQDDESEVSEEE